MRVELESAVRSLQVIWTMGTGYVHQRHSGTNPSTLSPLVLLEYGPLGGRKNVLYVDRRYPMISVTGGQCLNKHIAD
jgi:hypothetical protein